MKTQLHSLFLPATRKQQEAGVHNKRVTLEANQWDFVLKFDESQTPSDFKFENKAEFKFNKQGLRNLLNLLDGYLTKLKANSFKKDQELRDEVFYDGWLVYTNSGAMFIMRLMGGYKIVNGKRHRLAQLKVYNCGSWDEVNAVRESNKFDDSKLITSIDLPIMSTVNGAFTPADRTEIEIFSGAVEAVLIGTSVVYGDHVSKIAAENSEGASTNNSGTTTGDNTSKASADDIAEYPF